MEKGIRKTEWSCLYKIAVHGKNNNSDLKNIKKKFEDSHLGKRQIDRVKKQY